MSCVNFPLFPTALAAPVARLEIPDTPLAGRGGGSLLVDPIPPAAAAELLIGLAEGENVLAVLTDALDEGDEDKGKGGTPPTTSRRLEEGLRSWPKAGFEPCTKPC